MVKLELNLPWKPVLAWPWGVTYSIDPTTFLITNHKESWDIEPWEVREKVCLSFEKGSKLTILVWLTGCQANIPETNDSD